MKYLILLFIFYIFGCSPEIQPEIYWKDVAGTSWGLTEKLNIYQTVHHIYRFGYGDTIYLTRKYWNPQDPIFNSIDNPNWIRYMKGALFNKYYKDYDDCDEVNLIFTWSRKEYADSLYKQPIIDNSITDEWFLWKIDSNGHLLMGYVDNNNCYYWELEKE